MPPCAHSLSGWASSGAISRSPRSPYDGRAVRRWLSESAGELPRQPELFINAAMVCHTVALKDAPAVNSVIHFHVYCVRVVDELPVVRGQDAQFGVRVVRLVQGAENTVLPVKAVGEARVN